MSSKQLAQPKGSYEKDSVATKDYWTLILLIAKGFRPVGIEVGQEPGSGQRYLLFVFPATARELFEKKQRGEKIGIDDFDQVEFANRLFKANLYRLDQEDDEE